MSGRLKWVRYALGTLERSAARDGVVWDLMREEKAIRARLYLFGAPYGILIQLGIAWLARHTVAGQSCGIEE